MDTPRSNLYQVVADTESDLPALTIALKAGGIPLPALEDVLKHNGPLPREGLFLGQAEDDSPVLLNLYDPMPGPVLIIGRIGSGKTQFLRSIAKFIASTHSPREIQFGVIINRVEEWQDTLSENSNCIGVFASCQIGARQFIQSLAMWTKTITGSNQSVLMLVDGLEELSQWDEVTRTSLIEILKHGPNKRVWTIATLHPQHYQQADAWLQFFHLRLFEHELKWPEAEFALQIPQVIWDIPAYGPWFMYKESSSWVRFWVPAVDE